jgi:hypothetical protein
MTPVPLAGRMAPEARGEPAAAAMSDVLRTMNYPHVTFLQYLCRVDYIRFPFLFFGFSLKK